MRDLNLLCIDKKTLTILKEKKRWFRWKKKLNEELIIADKGYVRKEFAEEIKKHIVIIKKKRW